MGSDGSQSISIKSLLKKLLGRLEELELSVAEPFPENEKLPKDLLKILPPQADASTVDQYAFWLRMSEFLRPGDIVLTETGTASYGGQSLILPDDITVVNSSMWLSIGYTLAACQGVALANRELVRAGSRPQGRTILFEGEGSLQMSAQAISDIIRNRLDVIIFVLNNGGYTIERVIHGFRESYNNVQPWRNLEAASYFGAPQNDETYPVRTRLVKNWGDLRSVLQDPAVQECKGLTMVEVIMDMDDCPTSLRIFANYIKKRNETGS